MFTYFYLSNIFIIILINNVFVESAHRQIYFLPEYNIDWERFFCSSLMLEPKIVEWILVSFWQHFIWYIKLGSTVEYKFNLPSQMTTQSLESDPRSFVAVHLYFPESDGWILMISMVMTPSVCVIGYLSGSRSLPPFVHLIWNISWY